MHLPRIPPHPTSVQASPPKLTILYNNIAGKWKKEKDVINIITHKEAVLLLTETHRRELKRGSDLKGFNKFEQRREAGSKKGGGVGIWVRKGLKAPVGPRQPLPLPRRHP